MWLIRAGRRRLAREGGFTMVSVMGAMLVLMAISVAAVAAAGGDIGLARDDQDNKQAYAAAEAGVSDYLGNLNADSNYWAKCTSVTSPVSQRNATTGSGRRWKPVPGSSDSEYSIELIPAPGQALCKEDDPLQSMIKDGNVRIRATGHVKNTNQYRTISTTFRRTGFLDFLYYTKFENQDPMYFKRATYPFIGKLADAETRPRNGNLALPNWVGTNCDRLWWGDPADAEQGRGTLPRWEGDVAYTNSQGVKDWYPIELSTREVGCGEIQFVSGDLIDGPFHSEDSILICGTATFGNVNNTDRIENVPDDWRRASGCSGEPNFRPELTKAGTLQPPPSNTSLKGLTLPGYAFEGETIIELEGNTMNVTNANLNGGSETPMAVPSNGVVYVGNSTSGAACGEGYDPENPARYDPANPNRVSQGCGDVFLSGTYTKDLTIAAQNDVITTGNTTRPADTKWLLGLIAGKFARVWHPTCTTTPNNIRIDAAILALDGSFTVDNYWCGGSLGSLSVHGAIAQLHRGVVGTGSGDTGYLKNYTYNSELKYRSPPHFLDPIESSWRILRQGEQSPPQRG